MMLFDFSCPDISVASKQSLCLLAFLCQISRSLLLHGDMHPVMNKLCMRQQTGSLGAGRTRTRCEQVATPPHTLGTFNVTMDSK